MNLISYIISLAGAVTIFKWSWNITDIIMDVLTGESLTNLIKLTLSGGIKKCLNIQRQE